jgi:hypothetical protein
MSIFFIVAGVISFAYGLLTMTGLKKHDISKDSEFDKKVLSERDRYIIGRYIGPFKLIAAGLGAISLGLILHFST